MSQPASNQPPGPAEPLYAVPPKLLPDRNDEEEIRRFFGVEAPPAPPAPPATPPPASPLPGSPPAAGNPPPPTPDPAAVPPQPDGTPPTPPTPPATPTPPAPGTPPAPDRAPRRLQTAEEVAAEAIRRAADKLKGGPSPAPTEPQPEPVDEKTALRLEALEQLQLHPKFSGRKLTNEYQQFEKRLSDYQTEWEKAHPGQEFDPDADEHDEWHEENGLDIDEGMLTLAETNVLRERALREDLSNQQAEHLRGPIETVAAEARTVGERALLSAVGAETFEQLREKDPALAYLAKPVVEAAAQDMESAAQILTPGSPIRPDASNASHQRVLRLASAYEQQVMQLPPEQRLDRLGRPYVPAAQYERMSPKDRQKAWSFRYAPAEMQAMLVREHTIVLNGYVKEHNDWQAKRNAPPAPATGTPPPAPAPAPRPGPPPQPAVPAYIRPPSGGGGGGVVNPAPGTDAGPRRASRSFFGADE